MRRRVRIACPAPPGVPLFCTFSTKRVSKSPLGKGFAKSSPEITKSYATDATTVPQGPPNGTPGHQKSLQNLTLGHLGGKGAIPEASGAPRPKMTSKRDPEASKKPNLTNTHGKKKAGILPCFGRHFGVRFAGRVGKTRAFIARYKCHHLR